MQTSAFSHSVVVKGWPARHCFISLPRTWMHLVHPAHTPTFRLEVSSGKSILLSWAGDMHMPTTGEENSVLVGREVLKGNDISESEIGMLVQVSVPPSCTAISVTVRSLMQWQDLALNVDSAQSAILTQMRVMRLGQTLPLWLEGGVCIMLTTTHIDPSVPSVVLHPMTQVEVHPPLENEGSEDYSRISFNPVNENADVEDDEDIGELDFGDTVLEACEKDQQIENSENLNEKMIRKLTDFVIDRLQEQKRVQSKPVRRDVCLGYRVLPFPCDASSPLSNILQSHPSLVIISKESIVFSAYKDEEYFIANLRKVKSPKENLEKPSNVKEERKTSEGKKANKSSIGQELESQKLFAVIVWENFVRGKTENTSFTKEMNMILRRNNCVMPNCCRRQMNLELTSIVEIRSSESNISTVPVSVDVAPLSHTVNIRKEALLDDLKALLRNIVDECMVIINPGTIMEVKLEEKYIDICLSTRNGIPLKLTKKSVVILETTFVTQIPSLPYIPNLVSDLDSHFFAKYLYLGEEDIMINLRQHIIMGLGLKPLAHATYPQFALLSGSKGSGKTSLVETLIKDLSTSTHCIHCDIVSFKQLKGKKMETIEKKLQLLLREAIFRRPSLVVLEDLDYLVPVDGTDQESGPVYEHMMQVVSMLRKLLDDLLQFCYDSDSPSVMVVGTCIARTSVHPLLVSPQGCHYFPCTFRIPPLESEGRVKAFMTMLNEHCEKFAASKEGSLFCQCCPEADEYCIFCGRSELEKFQLDTKVITRRTESFVLPDLNHLAFRTFFQARDRWESYTSRETIERNYDYVKKTNFVCKTSEADSNTSKTSDDSIIPWKVLQCDVDAALDGYTSLALRGISLSEKKADEGFRVGGMGDAKKILEETLTWPSVYPNLFNNVNLRLRSGVLLYGPPGCGKTLLANAVTAYCQLNFISVKGPELLSKYIGASEQAVRDAFERASSAKPCVLFFDEFESIAPRRGHDSTGVTDRVVNQLLTQMDGVEGLSGVYILAATSRPDLIDPALLRPGRLDKCVYCPMPTEKDRKEILEVLSEDVDLGEEINWSEVASLTESFSGADLQSILSTAQVAVAQEAFGDDLYKDIIPSTQDVRDTANAKENNNDFEESLSFSNAAIKEEDTAENPISQGSFNVEKIQEQVLIEKEKKRVIYSQKSYISDYGVSDDEMVDEQKRTKNTFTEPIIPKNVMKQDPTQSSFKIYFRHIQAALREVKPSVTQTDQRRYAQLYASFTSSKEGNFGQPSPGKRATLA
ncbi:peroxisome biogenesis factor 1-like [Penaeus japonicus]|uniref:peroxisome biogenesis factor 1-like n=1 Tax=Penaeus japonicus TaxID=27405 RepID=UPI001C70DA0B|nr:peroxisome biogenesis factor 1-like [Penaeus japonicus]